ncbi:MAG TPA: SRPBCC domain-containing protein [Gemmatimonadaceae bacterium]|jgi:uncharacterized protein YndB with AHSA1/START domain|nr:SRPBCC domain-containing protein [Gemmatimonadaceae bacterium]
MPTNDLSLTRTIDAPRTLVYAAWTDPTHLARWQGAPEGFTVTAHDVDLRPGGAYKLCMRSADAVDHWLHGEYRQVVPPERLVFTHAWQDTDPTLVTLVFADHGDQTEITLEQAGFTSTQARDGHEAGWRSTFARLAEYVARERIRDEIDMLRHQARLTHECVRLNVDGLTHQDSLRQPQPGGNCLNWIIGHLLCVDQRMLRRLGQTPVMPDTDLARYDRGSPPIEDPADALDLSTLISAWNESSPRIDAGLATLTPDALDARASFSPTNNPNETVRSLLHTLIFHQAYHAGQTGILRRLAGKEGAIR